MLRAEIIIIGLTTITSVTTDLDGEDFFPMFRYGLHAETLKFHSIDNYPPHWRRKLVDFSSAIIPEKGRFLRVITVKTGTPLTRRPLAAPPSLLFIACGRLGSTPISSGVRCAIY